MKVQAYGRLRVKNTARKRTSTVYCMCPWCWVPTMCRLDWYCPADAKINDKTQVSSDGGEIYSDRLVWRMPVVFNHCLRGICPDYPARRALNHPGLTWFGHECHWYVCINVHTWRGPKANYCRLRFQMSSMVSLLEKDDPQQILLSRAWKLLPSRYLAISRPVLEVAPFWRSSDWRNQRFHCSSHRIHVKLCIFTYIVVDLFMVNV